MSTTSDPSPDPTNSRRRRHAAIGVTAGLLGGGAIGLLVAAPTLTSAATDSSTTPTTEVVVEEEPTTTTDTTDTADAGDETRAVEAGPRIRTLLQDLVDDGTITAAQADAVAEHLAANRPERGGHRGGRPGFDGEVLAGLLGIDVDTLRTELRSGNTIAEIATEQGVEVQTVIDALVAEARSHLELSVDNGRLTQEEADAKLAELTERITERVNEGRPTPD